MLLIRTDKGRYKFLIFKIHGFKDGIQDTFRTAKVKMRCSVAAGGYVKWPPPAALQNDRADKTLPGHLYYKRPFA